MNRLFFPYRGDKFYQENNAVIPSLIIGNVHHADEPSIGFSDDLFGRDFIEYTQEGQIYPVPSKLRENTKKRFDKRMFEYVNRN